MVVCVCVCLSGYNEKTRAKNVQIRRVVFLVLHFIRKYVDRYLWFERWYLSEYVILEIE